MTRHKVTIAGFQGLEVRHVPEEDRDLDDVRKARPASVENPNEVREDLLSLRIEVADADKVSGSIDPHLA